ncbi:MAG: hypothetical protein AB8F74_05700 [Saprospiraceae bacterium]
MTDVLLSFLPYENVLFRTELKPEQVIERLQDNLEYKRPRKVSLFEVEKHKKFEGSINGLSFKINRVIRHRPTFLPQIKGLIINRQNETIVEMKMRLHLITAIFLALFSGILIIVVLIGLVLSIRNGVFIKEILSPMGFLLFLYLLTIMSFKDESLESIDFFANLFNAKIELHRKIPSNNCYPK